MKCLECLLWQAIETKRLEKSERLRTMESHRIWRLQQKLCKAQFFLSRTAAAPDFPLNQGHNFSFYLQRYTRRCLGEEISIFGSLLSLDLTGTFYDLLTSSALMRLKLFIPPLSLSSPFCKQATVAPSALTMLSISGLLAWCSKGGLCAVQKHGELLLSLFKILATSRDGVFMKRERAICGVS